MDKIVLISQIVLFIILVYVSFMLTKKGKVSNLTKIVIAVSSIGILAFDKVKLIVWLIAVAVLWVFHYSKKPKKNGMELE